MPATYRRSNLDRYRLPLTVAAFGLLSIAVLIGTDQLRRRSLVRDNAYLKAVGEIQRDVAISHLWLEEHVSGDEVDVDEIGGRLARSLSIVRAMLGESAEAPENLPALRDEHLGEQARDLARQIEEFERLSELRRRGLESGLAVGIGSPLDVEYDAVFARVLGRAQAFEAALEERRERNSDRSRLGFMTIVLVWGALIGVAALGLWNRELHRRRAEEALEQSEARLLQAQKLQAVGRLAGGLAHDINNYLAAIRGHCELVRRKRPEGDRIAGKMDAVIRTVVKASTLIDRLLAFSQKQAVEIEIVDLNSVLAGLEKMLRPSLGENVRIRMRLAEGLWSVKADLSQLEQVVVNLWLNARDAMPDGGVITVETRNVHASAEASGRIPALAVGRELVLLTVSDTGCGIPEAALGNIFDPFWTTKDKAAHSGMGLATVYGIVRQSGGEIQVESEIDRGSTFRIFLPRTEEPATPMEAESMAEEGELEGSERILLVDDSAEFREATQALLEALGYRVVAAPDGEQAIAHIASGLEPDLVLTDVVMPGMSGIELVERLRCEGDFKAVFMSGHAENVTSRHGLEAGDAHFIKKQFSSTSLARTIREVLDR